MAGLCLVAGHRSQGSGFSRPLALAVDAVTGEGVALKERQTRAQLLERKPKVAEELEGAVHANEISAVVVGEVFVLLELANQRRIRE